MSKKKQIIFSLLLIALSSNSFCKENEMQETTRKNFGLYDFFLGPAVAVFHSRENMYKEVHQQETLTPMLQLQVKISPHFGLWSDLGFFYNDGHFEDANGIFADTKSSIYHIFFGLGLKAQHCFRESSNIYIKAGPSLMYYNRKQNLPATPRTLDGTGFGATIGTGVQLHIRNNWYTNLFADYMFNRKTIKNPKYPTRTKRIDIGGFLTGLGLQYKF